MGELTFRTDKAYLVGAWCASALWGIFGCFIMYALNLVWRLYQRGQLTRSTKITIVAALILYGLSTAHVSLALSRLIIGFVDIQGPETLFFFANIGTPINRAKDLIYVTSTVIADSVVVWRCWAIWGGNLYVLTFPILLVFGTAVSAYGAVAQYFLSHPNEVTAVAFGTAMFSVSLTTNILVTLLSVGRIWWISRKLNPDMDANYQRVTYGSIMVLLFETGLVIAIAKIFEFTFFKLSTLSGLTGFNALYIVFEMIPQINGIVPTAIIIIVLSRRRQGVSQKSSSFGATGRSSTGPGVVVFAPAKMTVDSTAYATNSYTAASSYASHTDRPKPVEFAYAEDDETMLRGHAV